MSFEELDAAAKVAAATVPDWRHDVRQEAWVKFLRYRPRTRGGAMMMAFSARNDLLRKERTQRLLPALIAAGITPVNRIQRWYREKRALKRHDPKRWAYLQAHPRA